MFSKFFTNITLNKNKAISTLFSKVHYLIISVLVILLVISPILFSFFNFLSGSYFLYKKMNKRDLFIINIFFLIVWFALYTCYLHLLVCEPSIPLHKFDSIELNQENLVLIISYSVKFPSICRAAFVETLVILYCLSSVLGYHPNIYFF
jgi:hypothetical protein